MLSKKQIIILSICCLVIVGIGLTLYFVLRKKSSSSSSGNNITVNLNLSGSVYTKPTTISVSYSNVATMTIAAFVEYILAQAQILPFNPVWWLSMNINGNTINLVNYDIDPVVGVNSLLSLFGGSTLPPTINFIGSFQHPCNSGDMPTCSSGTCSTWGPFCDPVKGWICKENMVCPEDLSTCCLNNPAGQFATCSSGYISCGPCVGTGACPSPGCSGIGQVCMGNGWVCEPNTLCPDSSIWNSCFSCGENEHVICSNGIFSCSSCSGTPPNCPPDCELSGIVCGNDGTFSCEKGVLCPPENILQGCCTDPANPIAICSQGSNSATLTCTNCNNLPKPTGGGYEPCDPKSGGSCEGHGWACSSTGWLCLPGKICPSLAVQNTCCSTDPNHPSVPNCSADTGFCVTCSCSSGMSGCSNPVCSGGTLTPCQNLCCPDNNPCHVDAYGNCLCCPQDQICNSGNGNPSICCPPSTICVGGSCLAPCGSDCTSGEAYTCLPNQSCIELTSLSPDNVAKLKLQFGTSSTGIHFDCSSTPTTGFLCMEQSGCDFVGNEVAMPSSVSNYYPCMPLTAAVPLDPNNPGVGYCKPSSSGASWNICPNRLNPTDCNNTSGCEWVNILSYIAGSSDTATAAVNVQNDLNQIAIGDTNTSDEFGFWCDPSNATTAFSRVLVYNLDASNPNCSWADCWGHMAEENIIDVTYDETTGNCVALQACNAPASTNLGSKFITTTSTGWVALENPYLIPPYTTQSSGVSNSLFGNCNNTTCPPQILGQNPQDYYCFSQGMVGFNRYSCQPNPSDPGGPRVCAHDSNGPYTDSTCEGNSCNCAVGYTQGVDGICYKNAFAPGYGRDNNSGVGAGFGACDGDTASRCVDCNGQGCDPWTGNCNAGLNPCGPGWASCCTGMNGTTNENACSNQACNCRCYLDPQIPVPYGNAWCSRPTKSWQICTNPDGCTEGTIGCNSNTVWPATILQNKDCMWGIDNNESNLYCTIP